jgi:putative glycerol-1-phosphate prenyltransferase
MSDIYSSIQAAAFNGDKKLAVLIDPDKVYQPQLDATIDLASSSGVDFIFIGGSLLVRDELEFCVKRVKERCEIPVVLFPGSNKQVSNNADALLLLSLISGRNAEWLIGQHVEAALKLRKSSLEIISTGYILIDGGRETSVTYVSQTKPIPADKTEIAVSTAIAGELLGLKLIFMDAGSGALNPVSPRMIRSVKNNIQLPLIIGGGINTPEKATRACAAGADVIVVGNAIEKDAGLIRSMVDAVHQYVSA